MLTEHHNDPSCQQATGPRPESAEWIFGRVLARDSNVAVSWRATASCSYISKLITLRALTFTCRSSFPTLSPYAESFYIRVENWRVGIAAPRGSGMGSLLRAGAIGSMLMVRATIEICREQKHRTLKYTKPEN